MSESLHSSLSEVARIKSIPYFAFDIPHDMTEGEKEQASAIIAAHIIHLQNSNTTEDDPPADVIITYIFTIMALLFPDMVEEALEADIPLVKQSASLDVRAFLDDLLGYAKNVEGEVDFEGIDDEDAETIVDGDYDITEDEGSDTVVGEVSDTIKDENTINIPSLPTSLQNIDFGLGKTDAKASYSDATIEILASRWSVELLFTGGYVSDAHSPIFPFALIKALGKVLRLEDHQMKYFKRGLAPTLPVMRGVMWALHACPPARRFLSLACYEFREEPQSMTELAFGITRGLSHGYGIPNVALTLEALVDDLLTAYPALVLYPALTSQIIAHREERFAYWKLPQSERTYMKNFNRAEYKLKPLTPRWALVAVAVAHGQQYDAEVGKSVDLGPYRSLIDGVNHRLDMMGEDVITDAGSRKPFGLAGVIGNAYVRRSAYTSDGKRYEQPIIPLKAVRPSIRCHPVPLYTKDGVTWR
ncbi:hypothetical protein CP532_1744 [Ophiocordyceps camponoti-leonardi (nom. inval.)]|nr:hypothetical protein CP532_1744 [Ophiocordyceps camponoti-leonardi (nom. inval.)]